VIPVNEEPRGSRHLLWIPATAAVGFSGSFVFADRLELLAPAYHLVYFALVGSFVTLYAIRTQLQVRAVLRRRARPALALGILGGLAVIQGVLATPPSSGPSGFLFAWDLFWRGLLYGVIDGMLLSALPWLITWRAFGGEGKSLARCVGISLLALGFALGVTSVYHLGYPDFRGPKLAQANLGNAIASLPTLLARNPVASPVAHGILHITAVVHNPQSELFLPPHESVPKTDDRIRGSSRPPLF